MTENNFSKHKTYQIALGSTEIWTTRESPFHTHIYVISPFSPVKRRRNSKDLTLFSISEI